MAREVATLTAFREGSDEKISVLFNPTEYDYKLNAKYTDVKSLGKNGADVNYTGTENGELSLSLTIDGFALAEQEKNKSGLAKVVGGLAKSLLPLTDDFKPKDISKEIKKLLSLTQVDPKLHAPPRCRFKWGPFSFYGLVTSVSVKHNMFGEDGMPIRAQVSLAMKQQPTMEEGEDLPYESPDRTKRRVLGQDIQLYHLANEHYNDPGEWRRIALANGIKNPRILPTGSAIKIPAMDD